MTAVEGLRCREYGRTYAIEARHVCDFCFGPLEVVYDYDKMRASVSRASIAAGPPNLWRYAEMLPINFPSVIDLSPGFTPLIRAERLGQHLGLDNLYLKDDTRNPTGSFKDRVVSVALSKALEFGFKVAACA